MDTPDFQVKRRETRAMATTAYFDKVLQDQVDEKNKINLEFGRMSFTGENLLYFKIDGKTLIVDEKTGLEICEAMWNVAKYLGYS